MLYEILMNEYGVNEPIILSDLKIEGMSAGCLRQQIKKLTDSGLLKRYDNGIYFLPKKTIFKSGSQLSRDRVIQKKYLQKDGRRCGYISGISFANKIGITTQIPMACEVVTNKASKDYREVQLASSRVIIRKPRIAIDESNYIVLQFLDLMKDIDVISEITGEELSDQLLSYMKKINLRFSDIAGFLQYYPDKIYKNLYEAGLLYGVSTQSSR
jgi:hypothetical protein